LEFEILNLKLPMLPDLPSLNTALARIAEIKANIRQNLPEPAVGSGNFATALAGASRTHTASIDPKLEPLIAASASEQNLDPALLKAVIQAESGFNPFAVSRTGAQGLMQLMPGTAQALGVENAFDPIQNISGGSRYLRQLLDRFQGDETLALAAYNAGPGAVNKYGGVPPYSETQNYVQHVQQLRNRYAGNSN
jgi:soluble lytic murein transglycosylase-like protein